MVPTEGLVERLRAKKDAAEIARVARAAALADAALAKVLADAAPGITEAELALSLDTQMRALGADGVAFQTIVAAGPNAAEPHHRPGDHVIGSGELVVVDFGAEVDGYRSDMTRTVSLVPIDDALLRRLVGVVAEAQAAGVAAVADGVLSAHVDRACRAVIDAAGWGQYFVHGTGHGVGLDIHEAPALGASSVDTLEAGQVVTVEPGVYLPGTSGARIEDTVVVGEGGCRVLTRTPIDRLDASS
jgi:Xaa-Pro aminopeptidase